MEQGPAWETGGDINDPYFQTFADDTWGQSIADMTGAPFEVSERDLDPLHRRVALEARERIKRLIAGVVSIPERIDTRAANALNPEEDE